MDWSKSELLRLLHDPYLRVCFLIGAGACGLWWFLLVWERASTRAALAALDGKSRLCAVLGVLFPQLAFVVLGAGIFLGSDGVLPLKVELVCAGLLVAWGVVAAYRAAGRVRPSSAGPAARALARARGMYERLPKWWHLLLAPMASGVIEACLDRLPKRVAGRPLLVWATALAGFAFAFASLALAVWVLPDVLQRHSQHLHGALIPVAGALSVLAALHAIALTVRARWALVPLYAWFAGVAALAWIYLPLLVLVDVPTFLARLVFPLILTAALAHWAYRLHGLTG